VDQDFNADSVTSIVIDLGNRGDTLTSRGTDVPVTFNGGTGTDTLIIADQPSAQFPDAVRTYEITSTSVQSSDAGLVSYEHVEGWTVNAGAFNDTFFVMSTGSATSVTLSGGGGTNSINVGSGLWYEIDDVASTLDDIQER